MRLHGTVLICFESKPCYLDHLCCFVCLCICHKLFDQGGCCIWILSFSFIVPVFIIIVVIFRFFTCTEQIFIFFVKKFRIIFLVLLSLVLVSKFVLIWVRELSSFMLLCSLRCVFSFEDHSASSQTIQF